MTGVATAIVGSAVIGGYASNRAASKASDSQEAATQAQLAPFRLKKPYLDSGYGLAENNLQAGLDAGAYTGPTYAGMDPRTAEGLNLRYDTALQNQGVASNIMDQTSGFADNAANLYNMSSQDALAGAVDYSTGDQYDALLGAAMRDPYRKLTENTLPEINNRAMASGNMNSSRAGMAEAVANRGYQDRVADAGANIQNKLMNQYLKANNDRISNMTTANNNMASIFGNAYGLQNDISGSMIGVGNAFQADQQGQYGDAETQYYAPYDRSNAYISNYLNQLGEAPATGQVNPNLYDPTSSTITGALGGAQLGFDMYNQFSGFNNLNSPSINYALANPTSSNLTAQQQQALQVQAGMPTTFL